MLWACSGVCNDESERSTVYRFVNCRAQAALRALACAGLAAICAQWAAAQRNPATMARQASQAMAEQRFADAATIYTQLAESYPGEPSLEANLGMALHLSARDREAVAPLRSAAAAMPASFQAHFFLGASLSRLGDFAGAIDPLRRASRLDPRHPFARALLGDALEAIGEFSEAADIWRTLRDLEGRNPYPHAGLVRCREQLAAQATEELKNRDPESAYVLRLVGHSRLAAGQYPSALYLFRQALERQPSVPSVHEAIARIYELSARADWAEVERARASALPRTPCSSPSPACDFDAGRYETVATFSPQASSEALFWAARANAKLAEVSFTALAGLNESVEQLALLTDILASQRQFSKAADACRRALALGGDNGGLERQMAELLYLAKRFDEAQPLLERFLRVDSREPRWPALLGSVLAERQEFAEAVPLLKASLELPGAPLTAQLDLGRAYLAIGRPEAAVSHLTAVLSTDTDGSVHYQLAQAYQRLGLREPAREALAKYRALDSRNRLETEATASLEITAPD